MSPPPSPSPQNNEKQHYQTIGTNILNQLKHTIPTIVNCKLTPIMERACITVPSDVKWYENEYKTQNTYREMTRLKAELSETKNPFSIYTIIVYAQINSKGKIKYSGDVYEKERDPELHKQLDEHQKTREPHDISGIIMKSQIDKRPLGFFGDTIMPEDYEISLDYANTPEGAAYRIKKIIDNQGNDLDFNLIDNTPISTLNELPPKNKEPQLINH